METLGKRILLSSSLPRYCSTTHPSCSAATPTLPQPPTPPLQPHGSTGGKTRRAHPNPDGLKRASCLLNEQHDPEELLLLILAPMLRGQMMERRRETQIETLLYGYLFCIYHKVMLLFIDVIFRKLLAVNNKMWMCLVTDFACTVRIYIIYIYTQFFFSRLKMRQRW